MRLTALRCLPHEQGTRGQGVLAHQHDVVNTGATSSLAAQRRSDCAWKSLSHWLLWRRGAEDTVPGQHPLQGLPKPPRCPEIPEMSHSRQRHPHLQAGRQPCLFLMVSTTGTTVHAALPGGPEAERLRPWHCPDGEEFVSVQEAGLHVHPALEISLLLGSPQVGAPRRCSSSKCGCQGEIPPAGGSGQGGAGQMQSPLLPSTQLQILGLLGLLAPGVPPIRRRGQTGKETGHGLPGTGSLASPTLEPGSWGTWMRHTQPLATRRSQMSTWRQGKPWIHLTPLGQNWWLKASGQSSENS